jgi:integrase/recombinase XerD
MTKVRNTKIGSVYPFLDARTPMADSELLPVKISVILRGKQFRVGVKLYSTPEVFNKAMTGKGTIPKEAKLLKDEIDVYVKKAKDVIEQFPTSDKKMFTNLFRSESALKVSGKTDMTALFQQKIDELIEEDRAGSISFYQQALSTFKRFRKYFYLEDITVEYLVFG